MSIWHKRVELLANIAIIAVAVLLGGVLIRRYLLPASPQPEVIERAQVKPGTKLSLPGVGWGRGDRTLLLVLSTNCRYCTESAPFYQRLAREQSRRSGLRIVAVLPQETQQGRDYLEGLGVSVDEVLQAPVDASGAKGTPTLLLVNGDGVVQNVWLGKLTPEMESEVLSRLNS